jgi:Lar family restriction alleviation protein
MTDHAGATGIGKSSLVMQAALTWAMGEPFFGIAPIRPLRSVIIQKANPKTMESLLPCPFCGGDARMSSTNDGWSQDSMWCVTCEKCGARGPKASHSADAEQLWRKRLEV